MLHVVSHFHYFVTLCSGCDQALQMTRETIDDVNVDFDIRSLLFPNFTVFLDGTFEMTSFQGSAVVDSVDIGQLNMIDMVGNAAIYIQN